MVAETTNTAACWSITQCWRESGRTSEFRSTDTVNATFNAREGAHENLFLALALAVLGFSQPMPATSIDVSWTVSDKPRCG